MRLRKIIERLFARPTTVPASGVRPEILALYGDRVAVAKGERRSRGWLYLALGLLSLVLAFWIWAANARIEEVTMGVAQVIPSQREQLIQSLEGGLVAELKVREGDVVAAGQVLARLDPTRARASFLEGRSKVISLQAQAARLRSESLGVPLVFPESVTGNAELIHTETETYRSRKGSLDEAVSAMARSRALVAKELSLMEPMFNKGLVAETELLKLQRQHNELDMQIIERRNKFRADANNELARVEADLASLSETVTGRKDQVDRTELRAPVKGVVKSIRANTIGGVIPPGGDIMEIVPLEDTLLVEARIKPADVAFLRPGMKAVVKISAYDFQIYGGLEGIVELISPGALKEEKRQPTGGEETYYRVMIRTGSPTLQKTEGLQQIEVIPGMIGTVDILTGEKTVLNYLLKPVLRVREAFRER